ncbi:hypothetical protein HPP92_008639 [Vanilla planifolia]|uniref:SOUL heme-binding protein n=1 Tax=Vanilla planifolia TaxID=51239 RepID=A0A835R8R4_VANPL|nr:hypothetical protein HPP92_008639 [Vanilla planifolia]
MKGVVVSLIFAIVASALICVSGIESPQFTVIHTESNFEIRLYRDTSWMSASSREMSFEKATKQGFHRLFQYIQGANLNSSRIRMTSPVLTSIVPDAGPLHSTAYIVRFYLPAKFQNSPPVPLPELNLQPVYWPSHCVAVRQFSGFARDNNVVKEAENLAISLSRSPWANSTDLLGHDAYSIAQYNSPFRFFGRTNEVWARINRFKASGYCSDSISTF